MHFDDESLGDLAEDLAPDDRQGRVRRRGRHLWRSRADGRGVRVGG
jgi:hypothetical protein